MPAEQRLAANIAPLRSRTILEAAVSGRADAIVSFDQKDHKKAPSRFGISLRTPAEVPRQIRRSADNDNHSIHFSLRLPVSLKAVIEKMAEAEGTSMNQFLVMAAAENLTSIQTAESYFAAQRGRCDIDRAVAFLSSHGGEPPRPEDQFPDQLVFGAKFRLGRNGRLLTRAVRKLLLITQAGREHHRR